MKDFQMNLWLKSKVTSILWPEKGLNLVSFFLLLIILFIHSAGSWVL